MHEVYHSSIIVINIIDGWIPLQGQSQWHTQKHRHLCLLAAALISPHCRLSFHSQRSTWNVVHPNWIGRFLLCIWHTCVAWTNQVAEQTSIKHFLNQYDKISCVLTGCEYAYINYLIKPARHKNNGTDRIVGKLMSLYPINELYPRT